MATSMEENSLTPTNDEKATLSTTGKTQDDAGILDSEMLKFSSVRVPLAIGIGLLPVTISSLLYVSTFSIFTQTMIGVATGLLGMFSFQLFQVHRSAARRRRTIQIAQMAELSYSDVKRLVPDDASFPTWETFPEYDRVEWLNKAMDEIWPSLDKAISELIKEQLQPILGQYAMGLIKKFVLQDLTLGTRAPRFDGIKVTVGEEDETVLETMFQWAPENENLVLKIESTGPDFKVKVKDIQVSGILKFILKPLLEEVPCFGAVLMSFTKAPEIDFNLKFLGGSIEMLPGVDKLIDDSIRAALMDSMVWPCRIVIPVAPGDWNYLELHPIAELDVTLIEVENIMKTDVIGKSDPFCTFYVRQKADKIKRSTTKKNKKSAVWNESFILEVEDKATQSLTVRLMDDESLEKSQYIGSAEFPIADMKPGAAQDVWLDMVENPAKSSRDASRGRVHLLIIYKPLPDSDPRSVAASKQHHDEEAAELKNSDKRGEEKHVADEPPVSPHLGAEPQM